MKASEVRDLTVQELENKLVDLKKELFALRFQHTVNQLDNPARLKAVKKDIARVRTILTQKTNA
ncbi:MAG: 50S ribosomal protein L29 [Oscillospiraceae bacterium]|nr:50S ribosomal protein L29 [Oscillospiraceae bacterium]